ncbi:hypothetical protein ACFX13_005376 [Malus domestica]
MSPSQDPASDGSFTLAIQESKTTSHTRIIGVIRPPPGIRTIVDKTAHFVAKNGPEFHRLSEFRDGISNMQTLPRQSWRRHRLPPQIVEQDHQSLMPLPSLKRCKRQSRHRKLSSKLEIKNSQFNFLKPGSVMFAFFTSLADAYSKVLMPPEGLTEKLRRSVADMETMLERCANRLEWERLQDKEMRKTVDFVDNEDEYLPSPMTVEEVSRRIRVTDMEEDVVEFDKEIEMEMDDEEMQPVEEGLATKDVEEQMRVVKNWRRPEERIHAERDSTKYVVSPITGELIPISEMSEHMRISLIDPKFKEQKERMFAKIRGTTLAQDDEISSNIVGLARTRPDIFGTTEEEVSNAVRVEIEKKKDEQEKQVICDGHTGSIGFNQNYGLNNDAKNLPGPTAPPPKLNVPSARTLPPPPGPTLNLPCVPLNTVPYFKPMQVPRAYIHVPVPLPTMPLMPPPPLP